MIPVRTPFGQLNIFLRPATIPNKVREKIIFNTFITALENCRIITNSTLISRQIISFEAPWGRDITLFSLLSRQVSTYMKAVETPLWYCPEGTSLQPHCRFLTHPLLLCRSAWFCLYYIGNNASVYTSFCPVMSFQHEYYSNSMVYTLYIVHLMRKIIILIKQSLQTSKLRIKLLQKHCQNTLEVK